MTRDEKACTCVSTQQVVQCWEQVGPCLVTTLPSYHLGDGTSFPSHSPELVTVTCAGHAEPFPGMLFQEQLGDRMCVTSGVAVERTQHQGPGGTHGRCTAHTGAEAGERRSSPRLRGPGPPPCDGRIGALWASSVCIRNSPAAGKGHPNAPLWGQPHLPPHLPDQEWGSCLLLVQYSPGPSRVSPLVAAGDTGETTPRTSDSVIPDAPD